MKWIRHARGQLAIRRNQTFKIQRSESWEVTLNLPKGPHIAFSLWSRYLLLCLTVQ